MSTLDALHAVLLARRTAAPDDSYVARLYAGGVDRIAKKIGEEATEVVIAAKDADREGGSDALVRETADLWFHCMVMLVHAGRSHADVIAELERRSGTSGIAEKLARPPS